MTTWLLRGIGVLAAVGLLVVGREAFVAMCAGSWLAVRDLAELEVTVLAALAVAAAAAVLRGRRALELDEWPPMPWAARVVLLWGMSLAAVLGVLPGLALGLGPPAAWPVALVAVALLVSRSRRIAWLLSTSYGLAAAATLVAVRHVF